MCEVSSNIDYHGFELNETACMKYAPITLKDVERSFVIFKNILSHNKVSFITDNLSKYMVVIFFFSIKLIFQFF